MKIRGSVGSLSFIFPYPPEDKKKKKSTYDPCMLSKTLICAIYVGQPDCHVPDAWNVVIGRKVGRGRHL